MNDTEVRRTQALWYAWGRQDSGEALPGDAFAFADAYRDRHAEYDAGRVGFMPSMQDAFATWVSGGAL